MRKITLTLGLFIIGMILFFVLFQYNKSLALNTAITKTLQITADVVTNKNLDSSYRVTENDISLTSYKAYEADFKAFFEENATFNTKVVTIDYTFLYLVIHEDGTTSISSGSDVKTSDHIKAITSTVIIDDDEYTIHMIVDKEN